MKKVVVYIKKIFFLSIAFFLGSLFIFKEISAQGAFPKVDLQPVEYKNVPLLSKIATNIVNPIIVMFFGLALAYFVFGVLRFIAGGEQEEVRQKGRDHILWGLVGMGIMFSAWAILRMVTNTFSIEPDAINVLQDGSN